MATPTKTEILPVLSYDDADSKTQGIFDNLKKSVGMVPNLYATQAHSSRALGAKLAFDSELSKGVFSGLEKEIIALAVSQTNECDYCLAAHTAVAKMHGASEDDAVQFRTGTSSNPKYAALATLAQDITVTRGHPSEDNITAFFNAGYDRAALVELLGFVALNVFNNYTNHIAGTPVDFPVAPALD